MVGMDLPVMPPVKPMLARAAAALPPGMQYEGKWDGFRAIVFRDGDEVEIGSRNTRPFNRYFPEIVAAARAVLPPRCVVDGEIVVARDGHLDFEALLERIHPAASRVRALAERTPASLVVFDLLALGDRSFLDTPQRERRAALEAALADAPPPVHLAPATTDLALAQDWFERFEGAGLDGVVAKPLDLGYRPDQRVMTKVKHERTADVVVAGYREHKSGPVVGSLLLGLNDSAGHLQYVGVCGAFPMRRRAELAEELAPLRMRTIEGHPWAGWAGADAGAGAAAGAGADAAAGAGAGGAADADADADADPGAARTDPAASAPDRMPGAQTRWNAGKDLSWIPLRPDRVCEVAYDHLQGTRFRHTAQWRRWRPDRDPASCTYDQVREPAAVDLSIALGGTPG
jgi:ATP-dependent DNA ligase